MLPYGFCTLNDLKGYVGITDAVNDALLQLIINATAGVIERAAGRSLRRDHARTEYFNGGSRVIRVDVSPIAQVHSVRESADRDFETSGSYTELVEGTDYVIDGGADGGRRGDSGVLRRVGGHWMGSDNEPGCVRVVYTGGYKQQEEEALENASITLRHASEISNYTVQRNSSVDPASPVYLPLYESAAIMYAQNGGSSVDNAVFRFNTRNVILPTWTIESLLLTYKSKRATAGADIEHALVLVRDADPASGRFVDVFDAIASGLSLATKTDTAAAYTSQTFSPQTGEQLAAMQASLFNGHISFGIVQNGANPTELATIAAAEANRPTLAISHRPLAADAFTVPDDLRSANLLQASHEYHTRRSTGMISQAMRGVSIASGSSYLKTQAVLLPEVAMIAESYQRFV